ncbi:13332_t:CDS:2, partial [Gigaspora margarita]
PVDYSLYSLSGIIGTVFTTNTSTTNQTLEIICYNCECPRYIVYQYSNLLIFANNGSPIQTTSTQNLSTVNGILDSDETLFLLANCYKYRKPIVNILIIRKKNRQAIDTTLELVETKGVEDPNKEIAKGQRESEKNPGVQYEPEPSRKNNVKIPLK